MNPLLYIKKEFNMKKIITILFILLSITNFSKERSDGKSDDLLDLGNQVIKEAENFKINHPELYLEKVETKKKARKEANDVYFADQSTDDGIEEIKGKFNNRD